MIQNRLKSLALTVSLLSRHRRLTWEMTKREIADRYAGHVLGALWSLGHPLVLMLVYVFIFGYVFKARLGGTADLPRDYTSFLLSGMIPWITFQEIMNKGSSVIVANSSLVKQVVFPIEVLPVKGVLASSLAQVISLCFLLGYQLTVFGSLPLSVVFLPMLFAFQLMAMIGVCYIFSAIGVYFRDLKEVILAFSSIGLFLTPAIFPPGSTPAVFDILLFFNPFSYLIWCYQDVAWYGRIEHPIAWVVFPVLSIATFYLGSRLFSKLSSGFANVL